MGTLLFLSLVLELLSVLDPVEELFGGSEFLPEEMEPDEEESLPEEGFSFLSPVWGLLTEVLSFRFPF